MTIGPVEYIVVAFPGNEFTGEIAPELIALIESGKIRILDLIFIGKNANGDTVSFEVEDIPGFADVDADVGGLISPEDIEHAAGRLEPNMSAALLIWEDLWAAPFAEALRNSGGVLVEGARIPHEIISPALQTLPSAV
ncbi:hypothetical protein GCM10022381_03360 [Leifsonia kafniensis]|uniref:DUF1269 domain-containing protein n=1 Tax=Leifsonia kafniensis TaxID=475957 RepID=A0ABP7K1L3_9MICO